MHRTFWRWVRKCRWQKFDSMKSVTRPFRKGYRVLVAPRANLFSDTSFEKGVLESRKWPPHQLLKQTSLLPRPQKKLHESAINQPELWFLVNLCIRRMARHRKNRGTSCSSFFSSSFYYCCSFRDFYLTRGATVAKSPLLFRCLLPAMIFTAFSSSRYQWIMGLSKRLHFGSEFGMKMWEGIWNLKLVLIVLLLQVKWI